MIFFHSKNSINKRIIRVPVENLSKEQAMKVVRQAILDFKKDIHFDYSTGEVYVKSDLKIPFSKEM